MWDESADGSLVSGPALFRPEIFLFGTVVLQVIARVDVPMPTPPALQGSIAPNLVVHAFVAETVSEELGSAIAVDVTRNLPVSDAEGLFRIDNRYLIAASLPFCGGSNRIVRLGAPEIVACRQAMVALLGYPVHNAGLTYGRFVVPGPMGLVGQNNLRCRLQ